MTIETSALISATTTFRSMAIWDRAESTAWFVVLMIRERRCSIRKRPRRRRKLAIIEK